ncbi:MAG: hypothetical protein U9Q07_12035, partial [Planctomycetota bacterium]|nr:hypothetical protein [Planctomycetota bacterium]
PDYPWSLTHLVPGWFVGFGLLFTFVGLVAGMYATLHGMEEGVEVTAGLRGLLRAAPFSFLTSIAGLLCSILLAFFFRLFADILERGCADIARTLEAGMEYEPNAAIIEQLLTSNKEQEKQFKTFGTELATAIGSGFDKIAQINKESLGDMLEVFITQLEKQSGEHIERAAEAMNAASEKIERLDKVLGEGGEEFAKALTEGVRDMKQAAEDITQAMPKILETGKKASTDMAEAVTKSVEEMMVGLEASREENEKLGREIRESLNEGLGEIKQQAAAIIARTLKDIQTKTKEVETALTGFAKASDDITGHLAKAETVLSASLDAGDQLAKRFVQIQEKMAQINNDLPGLIDSLDSAATSVSNAGQSCEKTSAGMQDISQTLIGASGQITQTWESYRDRFEGVDTDLEKAFDRMIDQVNQNGQNLKTYIDTVDEQAANAIQKLESGIAALRNGIDELSDIMAQQGEAT